MRERSLGGLLELLIDGLERRAGRVELVLGGLGAAVSEYLSETYPVPVVRHGVNDEFGRSGKAQAVLDAYGVNADGIVAKAKQALAMKK